MRGGIASGSEAREQQPSKNTINQIRKKNQANTGRRQYKKLISLVALVVWGHHCEEVEINSCRPLEQRQQMRHPQQQCLRSVRVVVVEAAAELAQPVRTIVMNDSSHRHQPVEARHRL